jgi:hypothetical protein
MIDDKFAPLCTHEHATPGPWRQRTPFDLEIVAGLYALPHVAHVAHENAWGPSSRAAQIANARHIATWNPDVTAEIVELLREADDCWGAYGYMGSKDWGNRLHALLARIGERR